MMDRVGSTGTPYVGRFAPSPTGPLHLGSLVAALGSFLDARRHGGRWYVRIEDLDPPREMPGATDAILRTLERHGLEWDGAVLRQSTRTDAYLHALDRLRADGLLYPCTCTRKMLEDSAPLGPLGRIYPGTCRGRRFDAVRGPHALRLRTDDTPIQFADRLCGTVSQRLASELGDFVLQRADGLFGYQLAVVVDDAHQAVTDIVRGADLLDNTPRQIHLQRLLGHPTPRYTHLPIVTNARGEKLSKQTFAPALDDARAAENLVTALGYLGLAPAADVRDAGVATLIRWAVESDESVSGYR
ncbi:MAG: tRNA glutamyl-Q(34) synthetase GluQRS [Thiotrichales bacterium]